MNTAQSWLEKRLHYRFADQQLLEQAFTHRSASARNNERLEFLGDAVLDFVISEFIYRAQPEFDEGDLSRLRASLVKDDSLAELALDLGLGEYLVLGSGERKTGGHRRESILADALEALFGAVYLDGGFDAAKTVIETVYNTRLQNLAAVQELRDPKTRLQEWLQARKMALPSYELVKATGKDHLRRFEISCAVEGQSEVTCGESTTHRKAEQEAARAMLQRITKSE